MVRGIGLCRNIFGSFLSFLRDRYFRALGHIHLYGSIT